MRNKPSKKKIKERIATLLEMAQSEPSRANYYVKTAHNLRLKNNVRLPRDLSSKYCKKCLSFWRHGKGVRVRTKPKSIVYTCLKCNTYTRFGR